MNYAVRRVKATDCQELFLKHHYAKRMPSLSWAYGLFDGPLLIGAISFGAPASRHLQMGACPSDPDCVVELNRLCVLDGTPRNTESWFIARALKLMPAAIVVSYADTVQGHLGYVYRAANFRYAGWTDMERKTPRYDYLVPGKHSREAFRSGDGAQAEKVRRRPKVKYWTVTGDSREKRRLLKMCAWPSICWKENPPPTEHRQLILERKP